MDPVTIATTIGTLATSAGKVMDLVKSAKKAAPNDAVAHEALDQAQDLIIALRQSILGLQEDVLRLQEENSQLRSQVRQKQEGILDRGQYEIKPIGRDAAVVPKGQTSPLYCPNCYHAGKLNVLGSTEMGSGMPSHLCGICKSVFKLD